MRLSSSAAGPAGRRVRKTPARERSQSCVRCLLRSRLVAAPTGAWRAGQARLVCGLASASSLRASSRAVVVRRFRRRVRAGAGPASSAQLRQVEVPAANVDLDRAGELLSDSCCLWTHAGVSDARCRDFPQRVDRQLRTRGERTVAFVPCRKYLPLLAAAPHDCEGRGERI